MGSRKRVIVLQHSRDVVPWSYIAVTGAPGTEPWVRRGGSHTGLPQGLWMRAIQRARNVTVFLVSAKRFGGRP